MPVLTLRRYAAPYLLIPKPPVSRCASGKNWRGPHSSSGVWPVSCCAGKACGGLNRLGYAYRRSPANADRDLPARAGRCSLCQGPRPREVALPLRAGCQAGRRGSRLAGWSLARLVSSSSTVATAKPSRSSKPRASEQAKAAAELRQRQRISERISAEAAAKASQQRVQRQAQDILKKRLLAEEKRLAIALAEQRLIEMGGAGEGVGSPEQRAAMTQQQRRAQQRQQTTRAVSNANAKPAAKPAAAKAKPAAGKKAGR